MRIRFEKITNHNYGLNEKIKNKLKFNKKAKNKNFKNKNQGCNISK